MVEFEVESDMLEMVDVGVVVGRDGRIARW